jgi:hypothetical protein
MVASTLSAAAHRSSLRCCCSTSTALVAHAAAAHGTAHAHTCICASVACVAQSCWDASNLKYGSFLHSPLMDELQAVEEQLNSQVSP